jgi:NADH dehydrogenase
MTTTNALSGQHVIVIGAGYAGLMCALQLAPAVRVTLVDPAGYVTERIRSHQRATNRPDITHPLSGFLGPAGITHVPPRVTAPAPGAGEIVRAGAVQAAPSPASAQRSPGTGYGA